MRENNSDLRWLALGALGGLLLAGCATAIATAGSGLAGNLNTAILNQDDPELVTEHQLARQKNQSERAMLKFACRVGFCVDVRYFLQLQGAFHRDRIVAAAAEKEGMVLFNFSLREDVRESLNRHCVIYGQGQVQYFA